MLAKIFVKKIEWNISIWKCLNQVTVPIRPIIYSVFFFSQLYKIATMTTSADNILQTTKKQWSWTPNVTATFQIPYFFLPFFANMCKKISITTILMLSKSVNVMITTVTIKISLMVMMTTTTIRFEKQRKPKPVKKKKTMVSFIN